MEAGISVCRGLVSSMTQTVVADLVALVQFVAFVRAAMGGDKPRGPGAAGARWAGACQTDAALGDALGLFVGFLESTCLGMGARI